jgi:hypothetical protein
VKKNCEQLYPGDSDFTFKDHGFSNLKKSKLVCTGVCVCVCVHLPMCAIIYLNMEVESLEKQFQAKPHSSLFLNSKV